ncbi:G patch domain-containing protein TGH isoform X2 [Nymphaea colorata]|uniref:G patch domain-containing protein TGH isoform X2 n=1 Tax=Nymphaea colorata TaxID=210225 RepID=UPI00214E7460|nr:G patch domain-containing protein TGH isoform X2 [Nymphaea colorata]
MMKSGVDDTDEDFVFYGTPIEREEELSNRKRKKSADSGSMRSLPTWKQEVTDSEGRRRFHGAFTGGFSAGYYNTVGSKEGWSPQTFTSSRTKRAEVKEQTIYSFLDEDEKAEMEGNALSTSFQFDTFGFTAAEIARRQAESEHSKRPSAIPGPVPDEIVLPATKSVGVTLLLKMGWRHGHSIGVGQDDSAYGTFCIDIFTHTFSSLFSDARREARKAFLAFSCSQGSNFTQTESSKSDSTFEVDNLVDAGRLVSESTPVFLLHNKQDLHGLGYDPFRLAPDFKERKMLKMCKSKEVGNRRSIYGKDGLFSSNSGRLASGIGIGVLEDLDIEDEDIYASGFDVKETHYEEIDEPSALIQENQQPLSTKEDGIVRGFRVASISDYHPERFKPPVIPPEFEPHHIFTRPEIQLCSMEPAPPEVPPPEDNDLRIMIEGLAKFVARCGKAFEDISREKHSNNPLFCFLNGGNGHEFYVRKLWEERRKQATRSDSLNNKTSQDSLHMTAEKRGKLLGEKSLKRSSMDPMSAPVSMEAIQFRSALSDTFTKAASMLEVAKSAKPFKDDPAKQGRFEQFLKDKYEGGLRSTCSDGSNTMTETARAYERLDFEAAAENLGKGKGNMQTFTAEEKLIESPIIFTKGLLDKTDVSQVHEKEPKRGYPQRTEYQWRPLPILCKRFDVLDPFIGKPPPLQRTRNIVDMPAISIPFRSMKEVGDDARSRGSTDPRNGVNQTTSVELAPEPVDLIAQRPVDLYKAIFSDDSDDENEVSSSPTPHHEAKKIGVNSTLNRLIAGDFLASLGQELGLRVPPDPIYSRENLEGSTSKETNKYHLKALSGGNQSVAGNFNDELRFPSEKAQSDRKVMVQEKEFAVRSGDGGESTFRKGSGVSGSSGNQSAPVERKTGINQEYQVEFRGPARAAFGAVREDSSDSDGSRYRFESSENKREKRKSHGHRRSRKSR